MNAAFFSSVRCFQELCESRVADSSVLRVFKSMPDRCHAVIDAEGGPTEDHRRIKYAT